MLKLAITNLAGDQVAVIRDYSDALVTIPYNDSRTAEVTLPAPRSTADKVALHALALERMLKVWYFQPPFLDPLLVFWGPILTPTWTLKAGQKTLKLEAHDLSIRLKNHYLGGADTTIFSTSPGSVAVSGGGLRALRDAGKNSAAENTDGIPDLGIADGTDTHPGAFAVTYLTTNYHAGDATMDVESTVGFPGSGTAPDDTLYVETTALSFTGKTATSFTGVTGYSGADIPVGTAVFLNTARTLAVNYGDEVWQRWREIADDPFGPDFRLRPDDSSPGSHYAYLDTLDKRETSEGGIRDKRLKVIFQAGFGTENVVEFEYAPQGASVRNRAVATRTQTASNGVGETTTTRIAASLASRQKYGTYESWEAVDTEGESLKGAAEAVVLAYSEPPQNFTFVPRSDEAQRYFYGRDFMEGDIISCAAHFGGLRIWLPGFVNEVRLRQVSATGQTRVEIDALPEIVDQTDIA